MNNDLEHALQNIRSNAARYARPERYYDGRHDLAFATEKFENTFGSLFREFALNLCPVICDAVRDKLRVIGFSVRSAASGSGPDRIDAEAARVWTDNRMQLRSGEIHKEVLKCGDAYMIVWPDASGRMIMYPNRAANCTVLYDDEIPGRIVRSAKIWRTADKHTRLNLFYPERIEKYISQNAYDFAMPDTGSFKPFDGDGEPVIANPFGLVPVFHFANNSDLGLPGRSELEPAIPIQDGLNKSVLDMLVAMEFAAFRQRWAAGIEVEYDEAGKPVLPFTAGVERLWITGDKDARFGDFEAARLDQFLKVKDSFRVDMASATGTPLHYFIQNTGGFPSGESLKRAETRFLAKIRDRQESFGQVWADVMSFALGGAEAGIQLRTEWEDAAPVGQRELLENILLKQQIGLPADKALIEAGYGEADVETMTSTK